MIAFFVFGALAIIFIKDPPRWFISRWSAATFAGAVVGALLYLPALRHFYVAIGLWPYQAQSSLADTVASVPLLVSPQALVAGFYIVPLVAGLGTVLALTLVGAVQGVIYGLILPPIFRRPIDRALSIRSRLRDDPAQILPQLYNAYNHHSDAISILPHLAFAENKQAKAAGARHRRASPVEHHARTSDRSDRGHRRHAG